MYERHKSLNQREERTVTEQLLEAAWTVFLGGFVKGGRRGGRLFERWKWHKPQSGSSVHWAFLGGVLHRSMFCVFCILDNVPASQIHLFPLASGRLR